MAEQVYIASRFMRIPGVPEELEIEAETVIGVYRNEDSAHTALAEDAATVWYDAAEPWPGVEDPDEEYADIQMDENRWVVAVHHVLD